MAGHKKISIVEKIDKNFYQKLLGEYNSRLRPKVVVWANEKPEVVTNRFAIYKSRVLNEKGNKGNNSDK